MACTQTSVINVFHMIIEEKLSYRIAMPLSYSFTKDLPLETNHIGEGADFSFVKMSRFYYNKSLG